VSEDRAEDRTKSASGATGEPQPPASNQGKHEPIEESPGVAPHSSTMPANMTGGIPTPGDSKGVSVPSVQAAAGTSEESEEIRNVRLLANAPPGKPDGEVDTRA
jgi:hypothetical protein